MARILVVDDDQDILNLVQLRLGKEGHHVDVFGDGPAALAGLRVGELPELAVLDVSMPGMSGLELLDALRGRDGLAALPAVFLSARVLPEDIAAGEALGAIYLTKPFIAPVLIRAVENALTPPEEREARLAAVMGVAPSHDAPHDGVRFTEERPPLVVTAAAVSQPPPGH